MAQGAQAWLARRVAMLLLLVTAAGLAAGGAARLAGAGQAAGAEEADLYPALNRIPDETDVADLRGALYGLHAILRLHTAQEDEAYLSLDDDAETVGGGRP